MQGHTLPGNIPVSRNTFAQIINTGSAEVLIITWKKPRGHLMNYIISLSNFFSKENIQNNYTALVMVFFAFKGTLNLKTSLRPVK
jgi:hypothetical protein